jgi:hypothetical protein
MFSVGRGLKLLGHREKVRQGRRIGWLMAAVLAMMINTMAIPGTARANPRQLSATSAARVAPAQLKIISYYPANHPWDRMWTEYSHADTDADFAKIAGLGANAVRIFIIPSVLGFASNTVSATVAGHLRDMVVTAAAHGLAVQLTLFDCPTFWDPATGSQQKYADRLSLSQSWLTKLLQPYRGDQRIALVELENEVDPYDAQLMAWAKSMLSWLPTVLPGVPRTIDTWSSGDGSREAAMLDQLSPYLDVLNAHLYGAPSSNVAVLAAITARAAGRPVIIGEAGHSSGVVQSAGGDRAQLRAFSLISEAAARFGIAAFSVWTLSDFTDAGKPSWLSPPAEQYFGLYRCDGSPKPAGDYVRKMFTGTAPRPSPANYDGEFQYEDAAPAVTGSTLLGAWQQFLPGQAGAIGVAPGQGMNGSAAGYIRASRVSAAQGIPALYQRFVAPSAGSTISVSAWTRLAGATGTTALSIAWFSRGGIYQGNVVGAKADNASGSWQAISLTSKVPAGITEFQVYAQSADNTGTAYFDNVIVATS